MSVLPNRRALSPLVGVVLLIALAIIVAAVIGATALDLSDELSKSAQGAAGVKFEPASGNEGLIRVTYVDRLNTEKLEVNYSVEPSGNDLLVSGSKVLHEPGETVTLEEDSNNPDDEIDVTIVVTAYLESGEKSVIYDQTNSI